MAVTDVYAKDGVNVEEGDSFSSYAGKACRRTYNNSRFIRIHEFEDDHFRGSRAIEFVTDQMPERFFLDGAPDGNGTKTGLTTEALLHKVAGHDLIAMCNMDLIRAGGQPIFALDVLDVSTLGKTGNETNKRMRELIDGLEDAAHKTGIVLYKGETAELGAYVGSDNPDAITKFNWAGCVMGLVDPNRRITGDRLVPGQVVYALKEKGFRSNGLSSVRAALVRKFGAKWWLAQEAKRHIIAAAHPSLLYDRFFLALNGWDDLEFSPLVRCALIVHVTGGGIRDKFGEDILFRRGLSAVLNDLWEPPEIMRLCKAWRGSEFTDKQCYGAWNGGQGALAVIDGADAPQFMSVASQHGIDARRCGIITKESVPTLTIHSKFSDEVFQYKKE